MLGQKSEVLLKRTRWQVYKFKLGSKINSHMLE